jgi:ribosomal protein S18 acetylase RimI-like enzyme
MENMNFKFWLSESSSFLDSLFSGPFSIDVDVENGSLSGYVVDTKKENASNYLIGQGVNENLVKYIMGKYGIVGIIKNMEVIPQMRGKGIGTKLLEKAIDKASDHNAEAIILVADIVDSSNKINLEEWYESFGFKKIGYAGSYPLMILELGV